MQKNSQNFDLEAVRKAAESPAGQKLLDTLQKSDASAFQNASAMANAGDFTGALASLSGLLDSDEIKKLLQQLGR